ncbi:MAG TPA: hypothetical protein VLH36_02670, partial [Steroidobacteraceae bacterium]|nr:hypothetical protein [Steroidobacteraceae bacterium]
MISSPVRDEWQPATLTADSMAGAGNLQGWMRSGGAGGSSDPLRAPRCVAATKCHASKLPKFALGNQELIRDEPHSP